MTISIINFIALKNALSTLDNFKFDAKTTYTLSRNLAWVESESKVLEETQKKLISECENPVPGDPKYNDFLAKWEAFVQSYIEIKDLRLIKIEDLNIGTEPHQNNMNVRLLTGFLPIIEDKFPENKTKKSKKV